MSVDDIYRFPCSTRKCGYTFEVNVINPGGGKKDVSCPFCFSRYEINLIDKEKLKEKVADYLTTVNNAFSTDPDSVVALQEIRSMGISIDMGLVLGLKLDIKPKKLKLKIKDGKILTRLVSRKDRKFLREMQISA